MEKRLFVCGSPIFILFAANAATVLYNAVMAGCVVDPLLSRTIIIRTRESVAEALSVTIPEQARYFARILLPCREALASPWATAVKFTTAPELDGSAVQVVPRFPYSTFTSCLTEFATLSAFCAVLTYPSYDFGMQYFGLRLYFFGMTWYVRMNGPYVFIGS